MLEFRLACPKVIGVLLSSHFSHSIYLQQQQSKNISAKLASILQLFYIETVNTA